MPSPIVTVNGSAPPQSVTAASTVTIALASSAGVALWQCQAVGTDDTNTTASINATITPVTSTSETFTAPALGSAVIFQSIVGSVRGLGLDTNGILQPSYFTTFKVNVLTSAGLPVVSLNEISEQSSSSGWIVEVNGAIRSVGGGSSVTSVTGVSPVSSSGGTTPAISIVAVAPTTLTFASHTFSAFTVVDQVLPADTTGGAFGITIPTFVAGQYLTVLDPTNSWGASTFTLTTGAGVSIRNPATTSTYVTGGALALPNVNAASYTFYAISSTKLVLV